MKTKPARKADAKKKVPPKHKPLAPAPTDAVISPVSESVPVLTEEPAPQSAPVPTPTAGEPDNPVTDTPSPAIGSLKMNVALTRSNKDRSTQMVVYLFGDGRPGSVRVSKTAFKDKQAPETLELVTDAYAGPKEPKIVETKEERKARLAALPKLTAAQKVANLEAKLEKLRAKAAKAAQAAPVAEPEHAAV